MRSYEELQMDKAILRIRDVSSRVNAFTHNGLLKRESFRLIADADDILEFLRQVEFALDELDEFKKMYKPNTTNPDQLTLF